MPTDKISPAYVQEVVLEELKKSRPDESIQTFKEVARNRFKELGMDGIEVADLSRQVEGRLGEKLFDEIPGSHYTPDGLVKKAVLALDGKGRLAKS